MIDPKLSSLLIRHEGLKLKPYKDSSGLLTIGVGRCLETVGISRSEALYLLENDIQNVYGKCVHNFPWFDSLDQVRQDVVLSLVFNLGLIGFSQFEHVIKALEARDYTLAASEMLSSLWAAQVKDRAIELSRMMETGMYQEA